MVKANIFISHRWADDDDYTNLTTKLKENGFEFLDYSVPKHNPLDVERVKEIESELREQVRQCNYFIVFAKMAMNDSHWCKYEVEVATEFNKTILSVKPFAYKGNIPTYIQNADTEGGPVGFNTPSIIKKIKENLDKK